MPQTSNELILQPNAWSRLTAHFDPKNGRLSLHCEIYDSNSDK